MLPDTLLLSPPELIFSIFVIFIAYVVKGLSGFGSGLIAVPLLAFVLPIQVIVPMLGILSYSGTVYQSYAYRKQVSWSDIWPVIPFSLAGIIIALWLLSAVPSEYLVMGLSVFVVLYSVYSFLPDRNLSGSRLWAAPAGFFAGLVGALFSTGGPFYVIYLRLRQLNKGAFRATIVLIFLVDGGFRIVGYGITGLYTSQVLWLVLILYPVLFIGMYTGQHLHLRISQSLFNRLISLMLLISGLMLLLKAINSIT